MIGCDEAHGVTVDVESTFHSLLNTVELLHKPNFIFFSNKVRNDFIFYIFLKRVIDKYTYGNNYKLDLLLLFFFFFDITGSMKHAANNF